MDGTVLTNRKLPDRNRETMIFASHFPETFILSQCKALLTSLHYFTLNSADS